MFQTIRRNLLACLCSAALAAVIALQSNATAQSSANPSTPDVQTASANTSEPSFPGALLLNVGDLLDVQVFDTPELSARLRVDEQGEIILPLGGAVTVKGLTSEQAEAAIEACFRQKKILNDPHVDVLVLEYATQGVTVGGEVKTPGVYPWAAKHTVADFITIAGGVSPTASKTVTVNRRDREQVMTFQLGSSAQSASGADMQVQPGDRIQVARAGVVYVVGDVGRPGGYLIESKESLTVLQALALAQGMNKTAKYNAKLIRTTSNGPTQLDLPLKKILASQAVDAKLQDGDIVFVPVSGGKQFADKSISAILQSAVGLSIWGWR